MEISEIMSIFYKLLQISLSGSFAVLYLLALRIILKKLPKSVTYALWALVAFHLLCTVAPTGRLAVIPKVKIAGKLGYIDVNWKVIVIIYLAVLCILLLANGVSYIRLANRLKHTAVEADRPDGGSARARWMKVKIYRCPVISSAFTFGYFPPGIYLPEGLDESTENLILSHERIHIQRGDYVAKWMAFLLCAVNWYNPLMWCAFYFFVRDQEASCDELVLQKIGTGQKKQYADTILKAASGFFVSGERDHALAFGEANIKYRIRRCIKAEHATKKVSILASVLTMCFMVWGIFVSERFEINTVPIRQSEEATSESGGLIDQKTGIVYEMRGNGIYRIDENGEKRIYKEKYSEISDFFMIEENLFFLAQGGICIKRLDVETNETEEIFSCENGKRIKSFNIYNGILSISYTDDSAESRKLSIRKRETADAQEILEHPGTVYNVTQWTDAGASACLDMDGDGKAEEIRLDFSLEDRNENGETEFALVIGKDKVQGRAKAVANEICAISFDGRKICLAVEYRDGQTDGMTNTVTSFYQYEKDAILSRGKIEADLSRTEVLGDTILSYVPQKIIMGESVQTTWDIDAEGRLVKQEEEYAEIVPVSYEIQKELTVHEEPESFHTFVIQPQVVSACRITQKRQWQIADKEFSGFWVELICDDGMAGWVFVSDGILPETGESVEDVFALGLKTYHHPIQ